MNKFDEQQRGLSQETARRLLLEHGPNSVVEKEESLLEEIVESLREPLVLLLLGIGILTFIFGEWRDAAIIFAVICAVAVTEAFVEWRAGRAITALSAMAEPTAFVWRDDRLVEVASDELVPGDVIHLRAGSRIPADADLVEAFDLAVDESLVTGESRPVFRDATNSESAALLAGTAVLRGSGRATVTRTGRDSTLGRIAVLVARTKEPKTPLQRRMAELAKALLWVAIAASVLIPVIGIVAGRPPKEMLLTGLSLAFATVPEELSVLIIVVLGLGSLRLARKGAIVRKLIAAETLGAVTVVCSDKTGTLTENRMVLVAAIPPAAFAGDLPTPAPLDPTILRAATLATETTALDPIDQAVREASEGLGAPPDSTMDLFLFDRSLRLASGYAQREGRLVAGVKGAPEAVLERCVSFRSRDGVRPLDTATRKQLIAQAQDLGRGGRVLGTASRRLESSPADREELERDLTFEGLLIFRDPVRSEVPGAVRALERAGVTITVITGDQASTALAVAKDAGLSISDTLTGADMAALDDQQLARRMAKGAIVARAQPEDKLRIVRALGAQGEIVMVTGDGVNDAPALRAAAVGVAMGRGGTDPARQASQVVLTDDSFATLVAAVREGRHLYDNFRKVIRYYLAVKVALILIMAVVAILGLPLPFTPVQIVILELFMDLGAAFAFVNQPADNNIMERPPRDPEARFLDRAMNISLLIGAATLAALVLVAFLVGLNQFGIGGARTLALVVWLVGHACLGIAMAGSHGLGGLKALLSNLPLVGWVASALVFAGVLLLLPAIGTALGAAAVPVEQGAFWALCAAVVPFGLMPLGLLDPPPPSRSVRTV